MYKTFINKTFVKLISFIAAILILQLGAINLVSAETEVKSDDDRYVLTEAHKGNLYVGSDEVIIEEAVDGDLMISGGNVVIDGDVSGNLIVLAGNLELNSDVGGDLLAAAGNIIINGNVTDVRSTAGNIYVNSREVSGDFVVAGGNIQLSKDTEVTGYYSVYGGQTNRNAIDSPQTITDIPASDNFYNPTAFSGELSDDDLAGIFAIGTIISICFSLLMLIGNLLAAYFVVKIFPVFSSKTLDTMSKMSLKSFGIGLLGFGAAIIVAIALGISVMGWPLLGLLIALFIVFSLISQYLFNYYVGRGLLSMGKYRRDNVLANIIVGFLIVEFVFFLFSLVPIVGHGVNFVLRILIAALVLGAIIYNKFKAKGWIS